MSRSGRYSDAVTRLFVAGWIMQFFMFGMWSCLYAYTPELYPTRARSTGAGFASVAGRIGAIISPIMIGMIKQDIGVFGVFSLGAAASSSLPSSCSCSASKRGARCWRRCRVDDVCRAGEACLLGSRQSSAFRTFVEGWDLRVDLVPRRRRAGPKLGSRLEEGGIRRR